MKQAIFVFLIISYTACDQGIGPSPPDYPNLLSQKNADSIRIELTDYDVARITHQAGSSLKSREFQRVGLGILDSTGYRELFSSNSSYNASDDIFSFDLDFSLSLDSTKIASPIIVRYYHRAFTFTDVDTTILQYKFPYPTAEIFVTNSIMVRPGYFQDIDKLNTRFYFHPTGPEGLYEYDPATNVTRTLLQYGAGDHIAADSVFVFCDIGHNSIVRYNIVTNSTDRTIATFPLSSNILGLETYEGSLFAIVSGFTHRFRKYTYDGTLIDSLVIPGVTFHLTRNNGILYTSDYYTTIRRIELATMTVLSSVSGPARNLEGIRVIDGRLYFCDWYRKIVGSVPLQDLK